VGLLVPALWSGRSPHALTRTQGWDPHGPGRLLGALPPRSWLTRRRQRGPDIVSAIWRWVASRSAATRSRWQLTPGIEDAGFHTSGGPLERVGRWWSGPPKRVGYGMDGVRVLIILAEGHLVVPIDVAVRRPNPKGPGARCCDKLPWAKVRLAETLDTVARRGLALPPPLVGADSWLSDAQWRGHVAAVPQGTGLGPGHASYPVSLAEGRPGPGRDGIHAETWPWPRRLHAPGWR
jgi:hypothetical protein